MLGLGLLVRLGRQVLAGPVADSGVLPAGYYRHLVLAALEEEDFPGALRHLKWAGDPLLAQILVFRLRLLAARHRRQSEAIQDLLRSDLKAARREQYETLLAEEARALELLRDYEPRALTHLGGPQQVPTGVGP
jgi:plasmid stability protein